jgi:hypothetical protein
MGTLTYSDLPVAGQPEDVNQLLTTFTEIETVINGGIDATNITNASVTDTELASPNNSTYKTILSGALSIGDGSGSGTGTIFQVCENGTGVLDTAVFSSPPVGLYFDDADYTVANLTQRLRIRAQLYPNSIASATTFTVGLHSLASIGGVADGTGLNVTDTAVSGSTVAFATPATLTAAQSNSGDFAIPADGHYFLCVTTAAAVATDSLVTIRIQLQTRNT